MPRRTLYGGLWKTMLVVLELINDMALRLNTEGADDGRDQVLSNSVASSGLLAELVTDHATYKTAVDELNTLTDELRADHATFITLTNELHVDVDLNGAALEAILTKMDADGGITDTDYVAVHGRSGSGTSIQAAAVTASDVATITAAEATAGPAALTATATDSEGRVGVGMAVDASAQDVQFNNAIHYKIAGQTYYKDVDAAVDISAECVGAGDTVATSKAGALWMMVTTDGTVDGETDKAAQDYASAVLALAQYSIATNTLPVADHVPVGVIQVTEGGSGAFTWGTDSITAETETYYSFEGLPGIESAMASFALDAAAATITYGAVTFMLGTGVRVVATGKANVVFDDTTQVAVGKTGAYLLYALADDTEALVEVGAAYADLQTAKDAVRDLAPNPLMPLLGAIYVTARLNAFTPATTLLDLNGIDTEFVTYGVTTDRQEHGRSSGSTFTPIDEVLHTAAPPGQSRRP